MIPATKPPRSRSRPRSVASVASAKTSTTAIRIGSCALVSIDRSIAAQPILAPRTAKIAATTAIAMKASRISAAVERVLGREEERDQQDRPELPDRAGGEQERAEARAELARVAEDRDQRADRRRRHRRADEEQRDHDARGREQAPDRVGERERDHPPGAGEQQRPAADPLEVDLVAGEEEEEPEPEAREEVDELVALRESEYVRPDDDPEDELEDHDGDDHPLAAEPDDRGRERGDDDDREE